LRSLDQWSDLRASCRHCSSALVCFTRTIGLVVLVVRTYSRMLKVEGALMENQSLRANGSVRFFKPFLPFDNLLFFPTAMIATVWGKGRDWW